MLRGWWVGRFHTSADRVAPVSVQCRIHSAPARIAFECPDDANKKKMNYIIGSRTCDYPDFFNSSSTLDWSAVC